jgi:hypothetical protein
MTPFAELIEWSLLAEAAYIAAIAGIGIMLVAALGVVASLRAQDNRREHRGPVLAFDLATGLAVLVIVAAIVAGIYTMTLK